MAVLLIAVYNLTHPEEAQRWTGAAEERLQAEQNIRSVTEEAQREEASKRQNEAMSAINTQLVLTGFGQPRLELDGGSLDVYVRKNDFESIPFPDRRQFIEDLGTVWCKKGSSGFLPTLTIDDIRTGEKLGAYSCTLSRATLS